MRHTLIMSSVVLITSFGCSSLRVSTTPEVGGMSDDTEIVRIESRNETIVINASSANPLFSVIGRDGKVLVQYLTLSEIEANHPELHNLIKSAITETHADLGSHVVR